MGVRRAQLGTPLVSKATTHKRRTHYAVPIGVHNVKFPVWLEQEIGIGYGPSTARWFPRNFLGKQIFQLVTRYDVIVLVLNIKLVESLDGHATVLEKPKRTGLFVQHIVGCV